MCIAQRLNNFPNEYVKALCIAVLPCHKLHDKYVLKEIFINELLESFNQRLISYKGSRNSTTVLSYAILTIFMTKFKHQLCNAEISCHSNRKNRQSGSRRQSAGSLISIDSGSLLLIKASRYNVFVPRSTLTALHVLYQQHHCASLLQLPSLLITSIQHAPFCRFWFAIRNSSTHIPIIRLGNFVRRILTYKYPKVPYITRRPRWYISYGYCRRFPTKPKLSPTMKKGVIAYYTPPYRVPKGPGPSQKHLHHRDWQTRKAWVNWAVILFQPDPQPDDFISNVAQIDSFRMPPTGKCSTTFIAVNATLNATTKSLLINLGISVFNVITKCNTDLLNDELFYGTWRDKYQYTCILKRKGWSCVKVLGSWSLRPNSMWRTLMFHDPQVLIFFLFA